MSGEAKVFMATKDAFIRAYMAGAILALAAAFAVTINQSTGQPLVGALLFPVGFSMLYLLGYDLLTGVVVLTPWRSSTGAPASRSGACCATGCRVPRQFRRGPHGGRDDGHRLHLRLRHRAQRGRQSSSPASARPARSATRNTAPAGMLTLFVRAMMCNWMVSTGVIGAMLSTSVPGKVIAMWMPITGVLLHGIRAFRREHVPVPVGAASWAAISRCSIT